MHPIDEAAARNRWKPITATTVVVAGVIALGFLVVAKDSIPPQDENPYTTVGMIDYGNVTQGSAQRNVKQPPSPNPEVGKTTSPTDLPPTEQASEDFITSQVASDLHALEAKETTKPEATAPQPQEPQEEALTFEYTAESGRQGGSNHGTGTEVGDAGNPTSDFLDPQGLFSFGSGENGLEGRRLLSYSYPTYDVQDEGRARFELVIAPDGSVRTARAVNYGVGAALRQRTVQELLKWKFSPIRSQRDQRVQITFTFKLK